MFRNIFKTKLFSWAQYKRSTYKWIEEELDKVMRQEQKQ